MKNPSPHSACPIISRTGEIVCEMKSVFLCHPERENRGNAEWDALFVTKCPTVKTHLPDLAHLRTLARIQSFPTVLSCFKPATIVFQGFMLGFPVCQPPNSDGEGAP